MALSRKITSSDITTYGVVSAPDKLTGTATENKRVFDKLIRDCVASIYNQLVDDLLAQTASADIGFTPITGVSSTNVQNAISTVKTQVDTKADSAATTTALNLKSDKSDTDLHFMDISLNEQTGVITMTRQNGTTKSIDTALEKVVTNWTYDPTTQSLVLTLKDGSTVNIPLSSFITENEFQDSDTIDFSVVNHVVSAAIKTGSITDVMLHSDLVATLQGYVTSASTSATNAATSETNASTYKTQAQSAKDDAVNAKTAAESAMNSAQTFANNANISSVAAATSASTALTAETNATTASTNASRSAAEAEDSAELASDKVLASIAENANGHMIATYADGSTVDLGAVMADGYVRVSTTQPTDERCKVWVDPQGQPTGMVTSVAGRTGDVTLTKSDVGLSNIDNNGRQVYIATLTYNGPGGYSCDKTVIQLYDLAQAGHEVILKYVNSTTPVAMCRLKKYWIVSGTYKVEFEGNNYIYTGSQQYGPYASSWSASEKLYATPSDLSTHTSNTSNPHSVSLEQVAGTGYVNNIAMVVTFSDNTTATYNLVGKSV